MTPTTPQPSTPEAATTQTATAQPRTPKARTLSLFEREMHDQVAAARLAVEEAERRADPLLLQAAQSHLDGLVDLARRNGVVVDAEQELSAG